MRLAPYEDKGLGVLYRYDEMPCTDGLHVNLHEYGIEKRTAKGVWIDYYGDQRFVLLSARKRFAAPTVKEAQESFRARKKRQVQILKGQLKRAESALWIIDNGKGGDIELID